MKRRCLSLLTTVALAAGIPLLAIAADAGHSPVQPVEAATTSPPHILVVVEENKGYSAVIGSPSAPYINSLAKTYASASAWYGVRHPSLPNYLAWIAGSTLGVTTDCTTCGPFSNTSFGGQLSHAGVSWRAYMQSMPSPCYSSDYGLYAKKHNPFMYFQDVAGSSSCATHVQPFTHFATDLSRGTLPSFVWVTPNLDDDMHDGSVGAADKWLKTNIAPILTSAWFTQHRSTLIITMDENDAAPTGTCCLSSADGGRVPLVIVSNTARGVGSFGSSGDHYGLLRSLEEAYALPLLGSASYSSNGDVFKYFG